MTNCFEECNGNYLIYIIAVRDFVVKYKHKADNRGGKGRNMRAIQTFIAAVLVVVLAINLAAVGLVLTVRTTLMRLDFYDSVFQKSRFYGQIRQWLFSGVSTELPNGREAIPYLEEVLTENWLRQELLFFGRQLFMFLKAETEQLPIVPVYKMFEELDANMNDIPPAQREKLIDYWFGGVPERVRLQDIGWVEPFWLARELIGVFQRTVWLIFGGLILVVGLFALTLRNWKNTLVGLGAALAAAGGIIIEISLFLNWAIMNSEAVRIWITGMGKQMFPQDAIESLLKYLLDGFLGKCYLIAFLFFVVGVLFIQFWSSGTRFKVIKGGFDNKK